ncbi:MAG: NAD(P)/FAD-dependent oxidoreductase [Halioglobus sp.]
MSEIETDYLIVGTGALSMSFADSLLDHCDATITFVDQHPRPGGHWNVAYPFVTLHQPSATYGLNSMDLDDGRIDEVGPNKGLYALATGTQVLSYFERAMQERFLPSGRVSYYPMSHYQGAEGGVHTFTSNISGKETRVNVRRKIVDGRAFTASVPATHKRKFTVADGVRVTTPGELPNTWLSGVKAADHYVILGAGKTAMDVGVWLLNMGVDASAISWVRPRESWIVNRVSTQPGADFAGNTVGWQIEQMRAAATATSGDDIFLHLEKHGHMLRLDRSSLPTKFHYPTISQGEVDLLRSIDRVLKIGRISHIDPGTLHGVEGDAKVPENALFIDCTATAAVRKTVSPIWDGGTITPQLLQVPLVSLSASVAGFIEATFDTNEEKNALAIPGAMTDTPAHYPQAMLANAINRMLWSQSPPIMKFLKAARLDPAQRMISVMGEVDESVREQASQIRDVTIAAVPNLQKLAAENAAQE